MRQIKMFKGLEYEYLELEARVNAWIRDNKINAIDVRAMLSPQSAGKVVAERVGESPQQSDLLITVLYEV